MRHILWILICLAAPAMAQPERALPEVFTVTGVASPDTLNHRAAASASADNPFGMPAMMECAGTEPFWGLHLRTGQYVQSSDLNQTGAAETYAMTGAVNLSNRMIDHFAFTAPPLTGFLTREYCDDGMSEAEYGWSLYLLRKGADGLVFMQGCCTALQP